MRTRTAPAEAGAGTLAPAPGAVNGAAPGAPQRYNAVLLPHETRRRMDLTLYHNPRCSKSRQALQLIRDGGFEPTIIEYLKTL